MRFYLTGWFLLALSVFLVSQTTIVVEAGPISYTNLDGFTDDPYSADISACTSIQFSIDYEFSEFWQGSDNMESSDECGACVGDPDDSLVGDCFNCWDFMWMQFSIGGSVEDEELIGEPGTTDSERMGTYLSPIFCTDGETSAEIDIRNQNFAADETNTYSNVVIYCWEGKPNFAVNNPVCGNLNLLGSAGDESIVDSWEWTSDMGANIDDPTSQNTFSDDPSDGEEFTLTATDENSCTASSSQVVMTSSGFDAELTGGGITCPGNCTDETSDVTVSISGGTGPYTVNFNVNGINVPFAPAIEVDEVFRICIDDGIAFPTIDASQDPIVITIPPIDIDLEINNIVDDTGCQGNIIGGAVSITVQDRPEAEEPVIEPEFCLDAQGQIDLTELDDIINGGDSSLDVFYYGSQDLEDLIDPANAYDDFSNTTIYANTWDGFCYSEFVEINFNLDPQPVFDNIQDIEECIDSEEFTLPLSTTIADITPINQQIVAGIGYYLDADGNDGPYTRIPIDTDIIYMIWTPDINSSCMRVVAPVNVMLTRNPILDAPLADTLSGCGSVILPDPEGDFFNDHLYEGDNGLFYLEGDEIFASDNVSSVTLTLIGDNGCNIDKEYIIDVTSSVSYSVPNLSPYCDSLMLPPITPATASVAYYTESGGQGNIYMPGQTLYAPLDTVLYLFDPNEDPSCAQEIEYPLVINSSPNITLPADTVACESLVLPTFRGTFSASARYGRMPLSDPLNRLRPGDIITLTEKLYVVDTINGCTFFDSINVSVIPEPYTGMDTTISICEGYMSTTLNFVELIGNPDAGGTWSYPMIPDFNPTDPTDVDVSTLPQGSHDMTYAIELPGCPFKSSTLTIDVVGIPYAGEDFIIQECGGGIYNFMDLISTPEQGGFWSQVTGNAVDISDSTIVDMTSVVDGNYAFVYTIEGTDDPLCDGNSASLLIEKIPGPNAGSDNAITVCSGSVVNVRDLLSPDADPSGTFFPDGFLLTGDTWNTTGSPSGTYAVEYVILSSNPMQCPNDTAFISIDLAGMLSAGSAGVVPTICAGDEIDLDDLIENESAGGRFVLTSDYTTIIDNPWTADADLDVSYIVDGVGGCDSDTLDLSISIGTPTTLDVQFSTLSLCAYDRACTELTLTISEPMGNVVLNVATQEITIDMTSSTTTINICADGNPGDYDAMSNTIFLGSVGGSFSFDFMNVENTPCPTIGLMMSETVEVIESPTEVVSEMLCFGDSIEIAGQFYKESTIIDIPRAGQCDSIINIQIENIPEAIATIDRVLCEGSSFDVFGTSLTRDTVATFMQVGGSFFGCDTILNLTLDFQNVAEGEYIETICDGSPRVIEGEMYDINNPSGMITLFVGSVAGCDSLITVQLDYQNAVTNEINNSLCSGDEIEINGEIYNEANPTGVEVLEGMAANGCDSLVVVSLSFAAAIEENIERQLCEGESEIINGTVYDQSNPMGQEMLMSSAGCDSIINVNLSFVSTFNETIDDALCQGSSIVVNGNTYNEANPSGAETLQSVNGCDSIITIDLSFISPSVTFDIEDACPGGMESSITVTELEGFTLPAILDIDGSNMVTINSLPFNFALFVGNYSYTISDDNCMVQGVIDIMASVEPNYDIAQSTDVSNNLIFELQTNINPINVTWSSPDLSLSCTQCIMTSAPTSEVYSITVSFEDENGCIYTRTIEAEAPSAEVEDIFIPNIFSPSDPTNSDFFIQSQEDVLVDEMLIYDRWGNLIFQNQNFMTNDPSAGWDATRDGKRIEQGVYVYSIRMQVNGRDEIFHGSLTIVR